MMRRKWFYPCFGGLKYQKETCFHFTWPLVIVTSYGRIIQRLYYRRILQMNVSRRLGILVFFAVPAIIGGGILYWLFHSYVPVFVYEILLILVAGGFAGK